MACSLQSLMSGRLLSHWALSLPSSSPSSSAKTQAHLACPVAPIGQGCTTSFPAGVQSHCSWREVVPGHQEEEEEEEEDGEDGLATFTDGVGTNTSRLEGNSVDLGKKEAKVRQVCHVGR